MRGAMNRAITSAPPPGPAGMMNSTGFCGSHAASIRPSGMKTTTMPSSHANQTQCLICISLPHPGQPHQRHEKHAASVGDPHLGDERGGTMVTEFTNRSYGLMEKHIGHVHPSLGACRECIQGGMCMS